MRLLAGLLSLMGLLGSCGANNTNSSGNAVANSPMPAPSPTPLPTPSPMPLPALPPSISNTGEVKPDASSTFISANLELDITGGASQMNGVITGGATSGRSTEIDTRNFNANYSNLVGYTLSDAFNSINFSPIQLTRDTTIRNGNGVVLFTNIVENRQDYLALYQQTAFSSSSEGGGFTTARYGGTAGWQNTVLVGQARRTRLNYFGYGPATPVAAMPRSGIVTFSVLATGNYATDTDLWFLSSGNGNVISVDFGTQTVSRKIGLRGENFFKSVVGGIGSFPIDGAIIGNSLTGSFSEGSFGTSGRVPGQFKLLFVGPSAEELIITFVVNDGSQALAGAAVAVREPSRN